MTPWDDGTFEIGLDEAGYGPLLGPLVIGAVRVDGPLESLRAASRSRRSGAPRIQDSKVLFQGRSGIERLEITALSAIAVATGSVPGTVRDYWAAVPSGLAEHPWYGDLDAPLPRWAPPDAVAEAAAVLSAALAARGARLSRARAFCHLEGSLNAKIHDLANKADVHLDHVGRALEDVLGESRRNGRVNCDRLGGRRDYGPFLSLLFPFVPMAALVLTPRESRYAVGPEPTALSIRFLVDGERRAKEIALASCLAKYGRELMMDAFNATFTAKYATLRPTAGYTTDARRFLRELAAAAGDDGWSRRLARIR